MSLYFIIILTTFGSSVKMMTIVIPFTLISLIHTD